MNAASERPVPTSQKVGARIESVRQQLLCCGAVMSGLVEPQSQPLVAEALAKIAAMACRIAVVGQIKSGKSTFINAFVRHPRLLPTSITPWTTAVTHLHFGQTSPFGGAARFTFMERNEWREIAHGSGRLRELTEKLVPDFEPRLLHNQTHALSERARRKLGAEFEQLLGQSHLYQKIAPGVLERYICSGDFSDSDVIGKYADITRSADIYPPDGPFDFPTSVIDTPGVNDPTLVRDELTRRSLSSADIYLIVLTARQPLSAQDVALLRLLRGLDRDRVVVLVNRIDELAELDEELPQVTAFVRERLAREFPDASIPVVYGSAAWATQSMLFEPQVVSRLLTRPSASGLFRSGLLRPTDAEPKALADPETRQRVSHALYAMSGMPAVYDAVESMMWLAQPAFALSLIARGFAEMSNGCERAAEAELMALLADRSRHLASRSAPTSTELNRRERDLLIEVSANIDASAQAIGTLFARLVDEERARIKGALDRIVAIHAARERQVLIDALTRGASPGTWTHEGFELRRALADAFRKEFKLSSERILEFHRRLIPELFKLLQTVVPTSELVAPLNKISEIPVPNSAPLSRMLVLDLDQSRWQIFWKRSTTAEQAGARIETLIKSEFSMVAEELAQSCGRAFHEFGAATVGWALGACRNIQHALQRLREHLLEEEQRALSKDTADGSGPYDRRILEQAQRLKDTEALTSHLDSLARELEGFLKPGASGS